MPDSPCATIAGALSTLFECDQSANGMTRVRTPFLYPDGDVIDLYVRYNADGVGGFVSDAGETSRWLKSQTLAPKRSPKQNAIIQDICKTLGTEFFQGALTARFSEVTSLTDTMIRVSQAAMRVSDLWLSFRNRGFESAEDEVQEFLEEKHIAFERSPQLTGKSGRVWHPSFRTMAARRSSLVYVLSTGSRSAAKSVTERVVTAWLDLSVMQRQTDPFRFVSIVDDTADVWNPEDFRLLENQSDVLRWSDTSEVERTLKDAA